MSIRHRIDGYFSLGCKCKIITLTLFLIDVYYEYIIHSQSLYLKFNVLRLNEFKTSLSYK